MSDLVSIIIPVYNVEEYLSACVESVIKQSYPHLEIILVDDGSTDHSGEMCEALKKQDNRICVIHKKNGGLSSARNAGLELCSGTYVYFLDSDDLIEETVIGRYIAILKQEDADVCRGSFYPFWGALKDPHTLCRTAAPTEVFSTVEALKLMFMDEKLYHAATCGLFKTELFTGIRFPLGLLYEDFATTYHVTSRCKKIAFVDDRSYFYRTRPSSIMNAAVSKKDMVLLDIAEKVRQDIVPLFPEVEKEALRKEMVEYLKFYSRILFTGFHSFEEEQQRIRSFILKNCTAFKESGLASKKDLIKLQAFQMGKLPFYIVYKISNRIQQIQMAL